MSNPCTHCGRKGIPGLIKGAGKCQYHWNKDAYGQAAANAEMYRQGWHLYCDGMEFKEDLDAIAMTLGTVIYESWLFDNKWWIRRL